MLKDEEREEIASAMAEYPQPQGACVEALKIIQRSRGWVPDDELREAAALLDMTPAELDGIATFYPFVFRRPVGRHIIQVCNTVSCWVMGQEAVIDILSDRLGIGTGETTADGLFTLLTVPCLGACDQAPAMLVDGRLHGNLSADGIDRIIAVLREEED